MLIPDIVDNSTIKLFQVLNELLGKAKQAHFASGYFNPRGYALVKDSIKGLEHFRLLLGREPTPQSEPTRTGRSIAFYDAEMRAEIEQSMVDGEMPALLQDLIEFIERDSVEARLYLKSFFHGKTYIFEGVQMFGDIAYVGSSNFTAAGLTANSELNTAHKEAAVVRDLKAWFDKFWEQAEDYKEPLLALLKDFTKKYLPYEIYIKTLYEYYKDQLDIAPPAELERGPIDLADFQREGLEIAMRILAKYDGVFIADSVGLGKTYIGLAILNEYAYKQRKKTLVVCPAQLKDGWWEPCLIDHRIPAKVVSQELLGRDADVTKYRDYDFVLVDESHNFRNREANRYEGLFRIIAEGKPKKVVLITATPVNNTIFDLYNQLSLITKGSDAYFAAAGIRDLKDYFGRALVNQEHLYDLLEEIAVRRTRHYIKKNFPKAMINGKPVKFPDRKPITKHYKLEDVYEGLYEEIAHIISNLQLAPYRIEWYRKVKTADKLTLFRGEHLSAIMRVLYLKRLESSIHSLLLSLKRQHDFQELFLDALAKGKLLDAAARKDIATWQAEDDEEGDSRSVEELVAQLPDCDPDVFKVEELERDVRADIDALSGLLSKLDEIPADKDPKLDALKETLRHDVKGKKAIIFTSFKDTARYLEDHLFKNSEFLYELDLGKNQIALIDSDVDPSTRRKLVQRFSPRSSEAAELVASPDEIQLLVSTDVLSEGQNLQDADTVINYDLHWNPVRMIQRAGRIDRIGSEFPIVYVYSFFPEDRLESLLSLVETLHRKLSDIGRSVGTDASVIGETVDPRNFNTIRRIEQEDETVIDELESRSELDIGEFIKQELLDFLRNKSRDVVEQIPIGVGSSQAKEKEKGVFYYFRAMTEPSGDGEPVAHHFWCYYDITSDQVLDGRLDILRRIRCKETTPRSDSDIDPYEYIEKAKKHIIKSTEIKVAARKAPETMKPVQSQVLNLLRAAPAEAFGADFDGDTISAVREYYQVVLPATYLKGLRKILSDYKQNRDLPAFAKALKEFADAHPYQPTTPEAPTEPRIIESDLEFVCYMIVEG